MKTTKQDDVIHKNCVVCGRKIKVKLSRTKKREIIRRGGHYFGKIDLPVGKGKYVTIGEEKLFPDSDKKYKIVKWTGKHKKVEYWECPSCFWGYKLKRK